jgi:hypothetical protein
MVPRDAVPLRHSGDRQALAPRGGGLQQDAQGIVGVQRQADISSPD